MDYPEAVSEKAKQHEELLQRVADGESREQVCAELGIKVDQDRFAVLQAKYEARGSSWQALLDGRHGHAQKMHSGIRERHAPCRISETNRAWARSLPDFSDF